MIEFALIVVAFVAGVVAGVMGHKFLKDRNATQPKSAFELTEKLIQEARDRNKTSTSF